MELLLPGKWHNWEQGLEQDYNASLARRHESDLAAGAVQAEQKQARVWRTRAGVRPCARVRPCACVRVDVGRGGMHEWGA